jgi:hypothetical protein
MGKYILYQTGILSIYATSGSFNWDLSRLERTEEPQIISKKELLSSQA